MPRRDKKREDRRALGSVFDNNGYWYVSVRLPGSAVRKKYPLKAPGAKHAMRSDRPVEMAWEAAHRLWEQARGVTKMTSEGTLVAEVCDRFVIAMKEYYRGSNETNSCACAARYFKDVHGQRAIGELIHTDMLAVREAMLRNPKLGRKTINRYMQILSRRLMPWALDEGLVRAATSVELSQIKALKRGRTTAREGKPVCEASDEDIEAAAAVMVPNTAAMLRVHRLTGMRPGELCDMRWELIERREGIWVYRPERHKNDWRGENGQPRAIAIGPKAQAILEALEGEKKGYVFSPVRAVEEWMREKREKRTSPFYPCRDENFSRAKPDAGRKPGEKWKSTAYTRSILAACERAGCGRFTANQLRHTFATEVRRRYGLEACRAVLGHSMGAAVTDRYSYAAIEDEMIMKATPAVMALG